MHNSQVLASLWMEDGDLMTPWGRWIKGQSQIQKHFDQEKKVLMAKARFNNRWMLRVI